MQPFASTGLRSTRRRLILPRLPAKTAKLRFSGPTPRKSIPTSNRAATPSKKSRLPRATGLSTMLSTLTSSRTAPSPAISCSGTKSSGLLPSWSVPMGSPLPARHLTWPAMVSLLVPIPPERTEPLLWRAKAVPAFCLATIPSLR